MRDQTMVHRGVPIDTSLREIELPGFTTPQNYKVMGSVSGERFQFVSNEGEGEVAFDLLCVPLQVPYAAQNPGYELDVIRPICHRHDDALNGFARALFRLVLETKTIVICEPYQFLNQSRFWESRAYEIIPDKRYRVYSMREDGNGIPITTFTRAYDFVKDWVAKRTLIWSEQPMPLAYVMTKR